MDFTGWRCDESHRPDSIDPRSTFGIEEPATLPSICLRTVDWDLGRETFSLALMHTSPVR